MPTNVTPEYKKAEQAFREAKTIDEKIERLQDMISLLPKHKGTDHLYADLKRRMAKLKKQLDASDKKSKSGSSLEITREGAAQVVLLGPPNSGKSSILNALTNSRPTIGNFPFSTQIMQPGMVPYKDIQIQLVDTPPVTSYFMPRHLLSLVRHADAVLLAADLASDNLLEDMEAVFEAFRTRHVQFVADRKNTSKDRVLCRVIGNKVDAPDAAARLELLREMLDNRLEVFTVSCRTGENIQKLPEILYQWLQIVRVYTKAPGEKPDLGRPYTVFAGQTVEDICYLIHKDFIENFRYARMWRAKDDPITVSRTEPVQDGDILELHI
ncbi:MAG: GTPase [Spirochaetota bacterium]